VAGPRNLQSFTIEYLVTELLDGITEAPPIVFEPAFNATKFSPDSQVYAGGEVARLGLIDPDAVTGGGTFGPRCIPFLWIDTTAVGDPGAALDVVGVRAGQNVALQKVVEDLAGDAGAFIDKGFFVGQGSDIRLNGFTAPPDEPIRVRLTIEVPHDCSDYALQQIADKLS
jgi:hypothetical protein